MSKKKSAAKEVHTLNHDATRTNIPTAEAQPIVDDETKRPVRVEIERRDPDLDPQLVWQGKSYGPLVVSAPPLYVQEKVHPKHLIDDLIAKTRERRGDDEVDQLDLFDDFNGVPEGDAKTEFYQHDAHWTNRMILGDALQVMSSLTEREGLTGQVQCIYIDPPYGIKFNSNFQWSTNNRNVKDGKAGHITREPEQVRAFRDTWRDGVHSYLSYLRDRLIIARELLTETGSIFVQIGEDNVHRVRAVMDEVFGEANYISSLSAQKTGSVSGDFIQSNSDTILWYGRNRVFTKFRPLFQARGGMPSKSNLEITTLEREDYGAYPLTSDGFRSTTTCAFEFEGQKFHPGMGRHWGVTTQQLAVVGRAGRLIRQNRMIRMRYFWDDYPVTRLGSNWTDVGGAVGKVYVVQTTPRAIERCILMTTDPGDLVLDPTCGSGTSAYVSEQWGRRWITIDTSRVALALARARIMGARYPWYLLADSREGQIKLSEITLTTPHDKPTHNSIKHGFVYQRVPHITLKSIGNNIEINIIWKKYEAKLKSILSQINKLRGRDEFNSNLPAFKEWNMPRKAGDPWPMKAQRILSKAQKANISESTRRRYLAALNKILDANYDLDELPEHGVDIWDDHDSISLHAEWWRLRIDRQREIDASIISKGGTEYLYDKPYDNKSKVRVAGPFTVESVNPHRMLGVDEHGNVLDQLREEDKPTYGESHDFAQLILNNLEKSGVQQSAREDRITFDSLTAFPGQWINAEGKYTEVGGQVIRAAVHIGPEFGSITRPDLVEAAREAAENNFDVLIACGSNYEAHTTEFSKLGRIPVLKARMNADLHMAQDLKATGAGNLFVIFGEPDIEIAETEDSRYTVEVRGVDIFDPKTGKVRSDNVDGIACWFVDTNYSGESFFVRHAYFLGAESSYDALKRSLKAEVDEEAWESLHSAVSRPFNKPETGRIAVKIINHLGDEVMKVVRII